MMKSVLLIACLFCVAGVLAQEGPVDIVRDGRYTVRLQDGTVISTHNEEHTAKEAAIAASAALEGVTVYIDPPAFRVRYTAPRTQPPDPLPDEHVPGGFFDMAPYAGWTIVRDRVFTGDKNWGYRTSQSRVLFLNCSFENNGSGLLVQHGDGLGDEDQISDIALIKCRFVNNWKGSNDATVGHSQGAYIAQVTGLLIRECYFDVNGWSGEDESVRSGFNHHLYIARCNDVVIEDCVFRRESYLALKIRSEQPVFNYKISDNVFVECALPLAFGANDSLDVYFTNVEISDNVFVRTTGWPTHNPSGTGLRVSNIRNAVISGNLFTDSFIDKNEAVYVDDGATPTENVLVINNIANLPSPQTLYNNRPGRKQEQSNTIWVNNQRLETEPKRLENFTGNLTSARELRNYYNN